VNQCVDRYFIQDSDAGLIDLVGHIMLTHSLAPRYAVAEVGIMIKPRSDDRDGPPALLARCHLS
jgi:hypothetical protein